MLNYCTLNTNNTWPPCEVGNLVLLEGLRRACCIDVFWESLTTDAALLPLRLFSVITPKAIAGAAFCSKSWPAR